MGCELIRSLRCLVVHCRRRFWGVLNDRLEMNILRSIPLFFFLLGSAAFASLGGAASTIEADVHSFRASRRIILSQRASNSSYAVHELTSEANTIREFVSSSGIVFAVTWSGWTEPDLNQLLGKYSKDIQDVEKGEGTSGRARGRHPRILRAMSQSQLQAQGKDQVIVEKFGHLRDVRGRAYIPSFIPKGVELQSLE